MARRQLDTFMQYIRKLAGVPAAGGRSDRQLLERFAVCREEEAFAELVERHGTMVLGVCRRVLGHLQDAEDAFQATFLVLARKAASGRWQESVGPWLHEVAYRTAQKAQAARAKPQPRERQVPDMDPADPLAEASARELRRLLDEELHRLPEKYRRPVVLCYLEGQTNEEAARLLGWTKGTVSGRLARARDLLRDRLTRRGVTLATGALGTALAEHATGAVVPAALANSTVQAALAFTAGSVAAGGAISVSAVHLAEGVLKAMMITKLKIAGALVLAAGMLGTGAGVVTHQALAEKQTAEKVAEVPKAAARNPDPAKPDAEKQARTDRYGDPLPSGASVRIGTVRFRGADGLHYLAYTPDGKLLVSGGSDGACIWDAVTGKEVRRLGAGQPRPYGSAVPSPDGKLVAVGGYDQEGMGGAVYELATGRRVYRFGKPGLSTEPCFSPDRRTLAASHSVGDASIDLHDAATGERLRSLVGHEVIKDITIQLARVVFNSDSKILVSAGTDGTIRFWNVATGQEVRRLAVAADTVAEFALSPDGSLLAAVCLTKVKQEDGKTRWLSGDLIRLWEVDLGKRDEVIVKGVRQLVVPTEKDVRGNPHGHCRLVFMPDGKALLAGGWDRKLRVLDLATGKELRRFAYHAGSMRTLALAPDGKTFAVVDPIQSIRVCDLATGGDLVPTGGHRDLLCAVALSPDGRTVVTASRDHTIRLWDATTGREVRQMAFHKDHHSSALLCSADGSAAFSFSGFDKTLRVWDLATGREIRRLKREETVRGLLTLSPDGKTLALAGPDNTVLLNDAATGKELRTLKGPASNVAGVSFSDDGRTLLAWSYDQHLHSWDIATGQHHRRWELHFEHGFPRAAFSADGRLVALGGARHIAVMNVVTGRELCRFAHGDGSRDDSVRCLAFAPDGRTLAWAVPRDPIIRLGEVFTGKERHRLAGHRGRVSSLVFSTEGKFLISGAHDTTALVWDLIGWSETPPRKLAAKDLQALWTDLAAEDAMRAYQAIERLTGTADQAVPFLKERLRPVAAPDAMRLAQLIADLDSDRFAAREKATAELANLGEMAEPALRKALAGKVSLEVHRRLTQLLAKRAGPVTEPEKLRQLRAIEVLEHIDTADARQVLGTLAKGTPEARLTQEAKASLERLANRRVAP